MIIQSNRLPDRSSRCGFPNLDTVNCRQNLMEPHGEGRKAQKPTFALAIIAILSPISNDLTKPLPLLDPVSA